VTEPPSTDDHSGDALSEHHIDIDVKTRYLPERSEPSRSFFFFAYQVTITNRGPGSCQLLARHWIITDANGNEEEVEGPGVVGQQPLLEPGESFTYSSGCPLTTKAGAMRGWYHFVDHEARRFRAEIPAFALTQSSLLN
jgi:ApaG protein